MPKDKIYCDGDCTFTYTLFKGKVDATKTIYAYDVDGHIVTATNILAKIESNRILFDRWGYAILQVVEGAFREETSKVKMTDIAFDETAFVQSVHVNLNDTLSNFKMVCVDLKMNIH